MDKKTKGSWLIHHTNKLQNVNNQAGYENTYMAGKAGILLSAISADKQIVIDDSRLKVLATAANINVKFELPPLLQALEDKELIDRGQKGIAVLGVTSATTLQHTADIFEGLGPSQAERAALDLSEIASTEPVRDSEAAEELGDKFKLAKGDVQNLLHEAEQIGFVDAEKLGSDEKLFFNGNLFRRDTTKKIKLVLDSLTTQEQAKLTELTEMLKKHACVEVESAKKLLGDVLFKKVSAVGLFDVNVVSNSKESVGYLTLPSAFSKYSSAMIDDAFDLAKAFVSSITYGMTKSSYERGQIQMVDKLLSALVRGESVGPVRAIAQDYKVLELKGVVEVTTGSKNGRVGPMLRLLKKEVGELALQAIRVGDVSEHSLSSLPTAAVTSFSGPEQNREKARRVQVETSPKTTNDMLSVLRKGGGI